MADCAVCIHKDACSAWIAHGKTLYNDFEYSVEYCPYFSPVMIPPRKVFSGYCPICDHHITLHFGGLE